MAKQGEPRCPMCGSKPGSCDCICVFCPVCDEPIMWYGEDTDGWQQGGCPHVLATGTLGEDDISWWRLEQKYQRLFDEFEADEDNWDESPLQQFAEANNLLYEDADDGAGHGHSAGGFVLFLPKLKARKRKTVAKGQQTTRQAAKSRASGTSGRRRA